MAEAAPTTTSAAAENMTPKGVAHIDDEISAPEENIKGGGAAATVEGASNQGTPSTVAGADEEGTPEKAEETDATDEYGGVVSAFPETVGAARSAEKGLVSQSGGSAALGATIAAAAALFMGEPDAGLVGATSSREAAEDETTEIDATVMNAKTAAAPTPDSQEIEIVSREVSEEEQNPALAVAHLEENVAPADGTSEADAQQMVVEAELQKEGLSGSGAQAAEGAVQEDKEVQMLVEAETNHEGQKDQDMGLEVGTDDVPLGNTDDLNPETTDLSAMEEPSSAAAQLSEDNTAVEGVSGQAGSATQEASPRKLIGTLESQFSLKSQLSASGNELAETIIGPDGKRRRLKKIVKTAAVGGVFEKAAESSMADSGTFKPPAFSAAQMQTVFESQPAASSADYLSARAAPAPVQTQTVFEKKAGISRADTSALRPAEAHAAERSIFEAGGKPSMADTGTFRPATLVAQTKSEFESKPSESKAHARALDPTVRGLGDADLATTKTEFEKPPAPSSADVRASDPPPALKVDQVMFESKPSPSAAVTGFNKPGLTPAESRAIFESRAVASKADVRWDSQANISAAQKRSEFENRPAASKASARWDAPLEVKQARAVFESVPKPRKVDASAFLAPNEEYIYVTDDEDEAVGAAVVEEHSENAEEGGPVGPPEDAAERLSRVHNEESGIVQKALDTF